MVHAKPAQNICFSWDLTFSQNQPQRCFRHFFNFESCKNCGQAAEKLFCMEIVQEHRIFAGKKTEVKYLYSVQSSSRNILLKFSTPDLQLFQAAGPPKKRYVKMHVRKMAPMSQRLHSFSSDFFSWKAVDPYTALVAFSTQKLQSESC